MKKNVGVFLLFVLCVLVQTFPLAADLSHRIPGGTLDDSYVFVWNSWWFTYAVEHGLDLTHTNHFYQPEGSGLLFHSHLYVHDAAVYLLQFVMPFIAAYNVVAMLSLAVLAFAVFLLARDSTQDTVASVLAGVIVTFSTFIMVRFTAHMDLTAFWPVPLFFVYFFRMLKTKKWLYVTIAGIVGALSIYNGFNYPAFIVLFALLCLSVLFYTKTKKELLSYAVPILGMVGIILVLASPIIIPMLSAYAGDVHLATDRDVSVVAYSASPANYLTPPCASFFYQFIFSSICKHQPTIEHTIFFGYSVVISALLFVFLYYTKWKKKKWNDFVFYRPPFWLLVILTALIFSFGDAFRVFGLPILGLPHSLLEHVPLLNGLRSPARFSIMSVLGLAMVAAFFVAEMRKRFRSGSLSIASRLWLCVLFAFFLLEVFRFPFFTHKLPQYVVPPVLREAPGTVLNIPFGVKDGLISIGHFYHDTLYYQTLHEKPIVGGYLSRVNHAFLYEKASVNGVRYFLGDYQYPLGDSQLDPLVAELKNSLEKLHVSVVIVYKEPLTTDEYERVSRILKAAGSTEAYQDDLVSMYAFP